jgi:RNA polymerase sigma-70 factor (ECF subfamily)
MVPPQPPETEDPCCPLFVTTHWSVVLAARDKASPDSSQALETLCRGYWYPLYAFVRRLGHPPHDAEDLTQEFFLRLLQKAWLDAAQQERGRFRTFLIMAMKRFLANEWDRGRAAKRGGGHTVLPLDTELAESRYQREPASSPPAELLYDRRWALTLLDRSIAALRAEYESDGRAADFDRLKGFLTAERGAIPYGEIARTLGASEGAARVAVHRMRRRFRNAFRAAVADTVADPRDVDDEVRYVVEMLGQS